MPKTEHWQWYVEESAPTEQHHHAIDRRFLCGAVRVSASCGSGYAGFRQDADSRRRHAKCAGRRKHLSRDARAPGDGRRRRSRRRARSRRRRGRDAARSTALRRRAPLHDGRHRRLGRRSRETLSARVVGRRVRRSARARDRRRRARVHARGTTSVTASSSRILPNRWKTRRATSAVQRRRLCADQVAARRRRRVRACRRARPRFTTRRCTARWRARCAATTRTSPRFSRTCRRSIPIGRSSPAATASIWRRSTRAAIDAYCAAAARREFLLRLGDAPPDFLAAALSAPRARRRRAIRSE